MGARAEYGKSKRDHGAILEEDRRTANGNGQSDTNNGMRGMMVFCSGCFDSSRGFSKMIGEGYDVG